MKDMIGRVVRLIVDVPLHMLGAICDLLEKLASKENGEVWFGELKRFLLRKPCWTGVVEPVSEFLKLLSGGDTLILDVCDGKELLAEANDMFANIDSNFKNWNIDDRDLATEETVVEVYELIRDSMFVQFFPSAGDISRLCFTQSQIKNFVVKYRHWLRKNGISTFFLFKKSRCEFFVAEVRFIGIDKLDVSVSRFGYDSVRRADNRHRVVIPQVA